MMAIVNTLTADIFTNHGENCLSKPENEVILKHNLPKLQEKLLEMTKFWPDGPTEAGNGKWLEQLC